MLPVPFGRRSAPLQTSDEIDCLRDALFGRRANPGPEIPHAITWGGRVPVGRAGTTQARIQERSVQNFGAGHVRTSRGLARLDRPSALILQ
jgi:hypothetical protein